MQRLFRLQNCLSRKSIKSWKYSKTFSPAELSQPQINNILEFLKEFFACRVVLAANQHYLGKIQRFFRLQNCLSRKSTKSQKYLKTFPPQELSQPQINNILEFFGDFFACRLVLAANQQYPGNIQSFFRLQNCLSRKSTESWNYPQIFRLQNCLSHKSTISQKNPKTFSPA